MHKEIKVNDRTTYNTIKQLSNPSKFRIIELSTSEKTISDLSKKIELAFNKCSNYCTELEKHNLIIKRKRGKTVFIKSKINLEKIFNQSLRRNP